MAKFPGAARYIIEYLKLLGQRIPSVLPENRFYVETLSDPLEIRFSDDELDDFEIALNHTQGSRYFATIENRIKFRCIVTLGSAGFLPELEISSILLDEKGDWVTTINTDVEFDAIFTLELLEGLHLLSRYLKDTICSLPVEVPALNEELSRINDLILYHDEKKNLNSKGVHLESLQLLKAAAVCTLMEQEKKRLSIHNARARAAFDKGMYRLVNALHSFPFGDIELPVLIHDYRAHVASQGMAANAPSTDSFTRPQSSQSTERATVSTEVNVGHPQLDPLLKALDERLVLRRHGAWAAFRSDNPDRLSQAANSMVEVLDQVISSVCRDQELVSYLRKKGLAKDTTDWVETTRKWISQTKSGLHRIKHQQAEPQVHETAALLGNAEGVMLVILEASAKA